MARFNIIGFGPEWQPSSSPWYPTKTCVVHRGIALISKLDEPGVLWCRECGNKYPQDKAQNVEE